MSFSNLILQPNQGQQLSKLQKDFNFNMAQIAKYKKKLTAHKEKLDALNKVIAEEFSPAERKILEKDLEILYIWDEHFSQSFFRKKEKEKIADIIINKANDLYEVNKDVALRDLYDKYAGQGAFEKEENLEKEMIKNMVDGFFGGKVNMENFDPSDDEKMNSFWEDLKIKSETKTKPKTAKQIAKEEKAKEEEKNISKATRAIYMDLVKAFHPDREVDEVKKLEKTEVMKKITVAYENDDLYNLLSLKLEYLDHQNDSFNWAGNHIKYYLKLLREQVKELEMELYAMERHCQTIFPNVYNFFSLSEKQVETEYKTVKNKLKSELKQLNQHFEYIKDKQYVREYLKDYEIGYEDDDSMFYNLF
jgi:hypothetical protein